MVISGTLLLGVATILAFFGGTWWRFDLLANFRLQYFLCLILSLIALLVEKKWPWAGVAGVFVVANFVDILPAFVGRGGQVASSSKPLTILLANVLTSNREYKKVREFIRSADPDIFAVLEASETWMNELSSLKEKYPHAVSRPREDNFGIALFSRIPFEESEIVELGEAGLPTGVARIRFDDTTLTVIASRVSGPFGQATAGEPRATSGVPVRPRFHESSVSLRQFRHDYGIDRIVAFGFAMAPRAPSSC